MENIEPEQEESRRQESDTDAATAVCPQQPVSVRVGFTSEEPQRRPGGGEPLLRAHCPASPEFPPRSGRGSGGLERQHRTS